MDEDFSAEVQRLDRCIQAERRTLRAQLTELVDDDGAVDLLIAAFDRALASVVEAQGRMYDAELTRARQVMQRVLDELERKGAQLAVDDAV